MRRVSGFKFTLFFSIVLASLTGSAQSSGAEQAGINEQVAEADASLPVADDEVFGPVFHKVAKGETVESIAKRYGLTMAQFNKWNFLPNGLAPGMKVAIKFSWSKKGKPNSEPAPEPKMTAPNIQYHEVLPGETLYHLSVVYHVTLDELREWNNLSGNKITVGKKMIVGK